MCVIPLDLERRFERRWAARFSGSAKQHRLEGQQHQRVNTPDKSKRKTRTFGAGAQTGSAHWPVASPFGC